MSKRINKDKNLIETIIDSKQILVLALYIILVLSIFLKGSYFPESYLPIFMATGVWLLIRIPTIVQPVFWKDKLFISLGIVLFCYIAASFSALGNHYTAILETLKIANGLLFFLAVKVCSKDMNVLYRAIVIGCFLLAVFGLVNYLGIIEYPQAILWSGRVLRLQSLLQYANVTALFMGIAYFLTIYLCRHSQSATQKRAYYFYGYFLLLALFLTYSRGATVIFLVFVWIWFFLEAKTGQGELLRTLGQVFVATLFAFLMVVLISFHQSVAAFFALVSSLVIIYWLWKWKAVPIKNLFVVRILLFLPPILLLGGGIGVLLIAQRQFILSKIATFLERIIAMQDALTILHNYPWLGIGPGSWSSLQFKYQSAQYTIRYLHNGFLQIALDAGILALLSFSLAVLIYFIRQVRYYRATKNLYELLPLIALGFLLTHSFIDVGLSFNGLLFIMMTILGSQSFPNTIPKQNNQLGKLSGYISKLSMAGTLLILILTAGYVWYGAILYDQGVTAFHKGQKGSTLLRESIPYRPGDAEVYMAIAQSALLSGNNTKDIVGYLEQARKLDRYEPRYVEELTNFSYQQQDLSEVYRYARTFMEIKPRDPQGYRKAEWSLQQMFSKQEINQASYVKGKEEIQQALEQSNKTLHPLAKYLPQRNNQQ